MTSKGPRKSPPARREPPAISRLAIAIYAAVSIAWFIPAFLPDQLLAGTDYLTGGYFFLEFAARRLADGSLPKWVPHVFGGLPMYSNPGDLFYPLRMLFSLVLPVERIMAAVYVVQFAVAGIGMHLLVRALGARPWVSLIAGLLFQLTGVVMSYLHAGQGGRIIVATLTPLVFYLLYRAIRSGELRWFIGLATALGFVMLSFQLQGAYYLLLASGLWALFLLAGIRREVTTSAIARRVVLGLVAVSFAFVLAAVNLLPFSGYIKDSPRSAEAKRDFAFSTQFSMPIVETIGFAVPEQAGILTNYKGANPFKLHTEYVGAVVILFLILGVAIARRDPVWRFMAALTAFMMSISYGSHTPIYELYYKFLPGTSKFRSPSIALFVVAACLVVMAALAIEALAKIVEADDKRQPPPARLLNGILALSVIVLVISLGTALDGGDRALGWFRFGAFFFAASLLVRLWTRGKVSTRTVSIALAVIAASDLAVIDRRFFWTQPPAIETFAADDVVQFVKSQTPGRVWVFPFPDTPGAARYLGNGMFGLQSDYLMHFDITQAGGEHGNQLYRWNQLVGISKNGNTLDWHNFVEFPEILTAAGVRYIISGVRLGMFDVKAGADAGGVHEAFHGSAFVYVNEDAPSRVTLVPAVRTVSAPDSALAMMRRDEWSPRKFAIVEAATAPFTSAPAADSTGKPASAGEARIEAEDPDRITVGVTAKQPAMLVLSDNYADGWVATVDGNVTPILLTNHTFRGVPVTAGRHSVVFEFKPAAFYSGLWISLAAWGVLVLAWVLVFALRRRAGGADPSLRPE